MEYLFEVGIGALAVYYAYTLVSRYLASTKPTFKARIIDACDGSLTIFVARVASILATVAAAVPDIAAVFGAQGVTDSIRGILPTGAVPYYIIAINLLTEVARRRTLST